MFYLKNIIYKNQYNETIHKYLNLEKVLGWRCIFTETKKCINITYKRALLYSLLNIVGLLVAIYLVNFLVIPLMLIRLFIVILLLTKDLYVENNSSIGLFSGVYGGINIGVHLFLIITSLTILDLWKLTLSIALILS